MNSLHCHLISIHSCYCSPHLADGETHLGTLGNLAKKRGLVSGSIGIQTPGLKLSITLSQIDMGSNLSSYTMDSLFGLQPGTLLLCTSVFTYSKWEIILSTLCL